MSAVLAQRLANVTGSATMKVAAEADRLKRSGVQIVDFGAGEPDFQTPQHVKDAAKAAIDANFSRYTNAMGIPEFREAICATYKRDYGIDCTAAEVLITNGGKQALFNTALALFNPGDEVITHAPYWPTIPEQIKIANATPEAIIINSPCNPTGSLTDVAAMTPIVEAAAARGIWVIVDLCYEHLIYDEVDHNLPKLLFDKHRDRSVICGSLSKTYAMTGWRAGWTIAPKDLTQAFNVIMGHTTSNIASIVQKAGVVALNGPQDGVKVMLDEYRRRRDAIHGWLTANPAIKCVKPRGAFYLFPDISELLGGEVKSSSEFAQRLIEQEHVALTPGEGFDAPGYLRISYATSMDQLREGATRILRLAEKLQPAKAGASR
ncbi:MAG: hypothetical protein DMF88_11290 [Acidobacteria bacterium]|nr:MAG: hypothetical protein DMF88_11290 [Acidobacteriota bacterium]